MKLHLKKKQVVKEVKDKLAKLLASEDITIEYRKVQSASFDVKKRVLTIPILKQNITNDLHDLFIGHEVGHSLYTPQNLSEILKKYCNKQNPKFPFSYLNVVEDARIERKIRNKFPGLKYSFRQGYSELKTNDFFKLDNFGPDSHLMERINLYFKLGSLVDISFNEEEMVFVDKISNCDSFESVLEICEELYAYCEKYNEEDEDEDDDEELSEFTQASEDENDENENEEGESSDEENDENNENEEGESSDEEKFVRWIENKESERELQRETNSISGGEFYDEELETQRGFDNAFDDLKEEDAKERIYVNIPKVNYENIIVPPKIILKEFESFDSLKQAYYTDYENRVYGEFDSFKKKSIPVVNHMVKEFEMKKRANDYKKTKISKTGVINTQKLFSYKFSDDIFKSLEITLDSKNHGLIFFIDWSGSMSSHISDTYKQLLNLVWFCRKANIPFRVFAFSDNWTEMKFFKDGIKEYNEINYNKYEYKDNDIVLSNFRLLEFFNSDMKNKEFNIMSKRLYYTCKNYYDAPGFIHLGGTPLNSTILIADKIINEFKKDNKLQIVNTIFLTDGVSHRIHDKVFKDRSVNHSYDEKYLRKDNVCLTQRSTLEQTKTLLNLLKKKTNCNILGFFLTYHNSFIYDLDLAKDYKEHEKMKVEWRKKKFIITNNFSGYDEFYVIKTDKTFNVEDEEMEIDSSKTSSAIKRQFMKYSKGKREKRIILSKFIEKIA